MDILQRTRKKFPSPTTGNTDWNNKSWTPSPASRGVEDDLYRIHKGQETSLPFVVAVVDSHGHPVCGGTIVHYKLVLTAAHCCLNSDMESKKVVVTDLFVDEPLATHQIYNCIIHPGWDGRNNDIGLIKLTVPINMDAIRQDVFPPSASNISNYFFPGATVVVAGWGATEKSLLTRMINKAEMKVLDDEQCNERLHGTGAEEHEFCIFDSDRHETSSCHGDSGGPVLYPQGFRKWVVVGVMIGGFSIEDGHSFCHPALPQIAMKVVDYLDWIRAHIQLIHDEPRFFRKGDIINPT